MYIILYYLICLILLIIFVILLKICSFTSQYASIQEYEEEFFYLDSASQKKKRFPSLRDKPSCSLSVIIPAYNEEKRMMPMVDEAVSYLEGEGISYEIIIVDDGSVDSTSVCGLQYNKKLGSDKVRVLTLLKNRGKGGAVRLAMLRARGELLLFADADGSTKFSDYAKVQSSLLGFCSESKFACESLGIACGSRAHLEEKSIAARSLFRTLLMYGFHFLVKFYAVDSIRDTQCGFKLMTRRTAKILFYNLHVEGWAFDVEMLYIAESLGVPISEVAVNWREIDGSKVTPVISWIQMGCDLFTIWARYKLGIWKFRLEE